MPSTSSINLSTLNGTIGVRFDGVTPLDFTGTTVSSGGDVNGDGFDDIIIGADGSNTTAGASYVVFGKSAGWGSSFALSSLSGADGFRIAGGATDGLQSYSLAAAGDINGDGYADLIIGAPGPLGLNAPSQGAGYVVFGKASGWASSLDVATLNGANGFSIAGASAGDSFGVSVASGGDVNGDGLSDLLIGAYQADPNGNMNAGSSYVVFGKTAAWTSSVGLSGLSGGNGFRLDGQSAGDLSGWSVASAGDFNGDGFADLVIGAPQNDVGGTNAGAIYVVYGSSAGFPSSVNLSSISGTTGFRMIGVSAGDNFGSMVSSAGDVNGDGLDDLIVAASFASVGGVANAGAAYVILGTTSALQGTQSANGAAFRITGGTGDPIDTNQLALKVAAAGDLNGDGFDDVILGRPYADPSLHTNAGSSYVIYGKSGGFAAIDLDTLDGTNGQRLDGVFGATGNGDRSGESVAAAGDVNGDGQPDILIGADGADPNGQNAAGSAYLVFGNALTSTAGIQKHGSVGADTINGAATNDTLDGRFGNDVLNGGAGNDSLLGGAGDDTLNGGLANDTIDGGAGNDTVTYADLNAVVSVNLSLTGSQNTFGGGFDTIRNVENLIGSPASDLLQGSSGHNLIQGLAGDDQINGLDGNDTIEGGAGNDTLNGGLGADTLSYASASGNISVSLGVFGPQVTGGAGTDTVLSFENLIGGAGNDSLTGAAGINVIQGGLGDDTIAGGLDGDSLDGGAGINSVDYAWATANLTIDLAIGRATPAGGTAFDTLLNVDNAIGGAGNDTIYGGPASNLLQGGAGNDVIVGEIGNDTIDGGPGDDTLLGDAAPGFSGDTGVGYIDTLTYASAGTAGVTVNLSLTTAQNTGGAGIDTVSRFENLTGGGGNDSLTGDAGNNVILGMAGDDTITGGAGNDTLDGGEGVNTLSYGNAVNNISVNLGLTTAQLIGGPGTDTVSHFANLTAGAGNDSLVGSDGANVISAGAGNDTITGGLGNDSIDGGDGIDQANVSGSQSSYHFGTRDGVFMLAGADGTDQLTHVELLQFGAAAAVSIASLAGTPGDQGLIYGIIGGVTGYVLPDVYVGPVAGLQNQLLGSAGGDTVLGTDKADFINALAGDDAIDGGAGNDVIDGGLGSNFLTGGAGRDVFFVDGRGAAQFNTWSTITDFGLAAGDALTIFGYQPGVSQFIWVANDGAAGFRGATMHWDLDGNGLIDSSVTFTGLTQDQVPVALYGADYIYIQNPFIF